MDDDKKVAARSFLYSSKPTTIEAVRITEHNFKGNFPWGLPYWVVNGFSSKLNSPIILLKIPEGIKIATNHGWVVGKFGDWLIQGKTDLYPCKHEEFINKYEPTNKKIVGGDYVGIL